MNGSAENVTEHGMDISGGTFTPQGGNVFAAALNAAAHAVVIAEDNLIFADIFQKCVFVFL